MNEATYMKERVDDQINWLSKKSGSSQKSFKRLRLTTIILSVTIPFLVSYTGYFTFALKKINDIVVAEIDWMQLAVGIAGVVIAAIEGIQVLHKHQDKWIKYRVTSETLKQEKMLFSAKAGIYANNETSFQEFVTRVETILGGENKDWSAYMAKNKSNPDQQDANKHLAEYAEFMMKKGQNKSSISAPEDSFVEESEDFSETT